MDRIASQLKTFGTSLGKPSWDRTFSPIPEKGQQDNRTPSWLKTDLVPANSVAKDRQALKQRCSSIEWDFSDEEQPKEPAVFSEESCKKRNKVKRRQDYQRKSRDHTRKPHRRSKSRTSSIEIKISKSESLTRSSSIEWGFSDDQNETSNKKKREDEKE